MGRCLVALALLGAGACNARLGDPTSHVAGTDGGGDVDAGSNVTLDGPAALGPWGTPMPIAGADDATNQEDDPTMSSDGLELYYGVAVPMGQKNLFKMTRATRSDPFSNPKALTAFNTSASNESPRLSYDDLTIYIGQNGDIYQATRAAVGGTFGALSIVAGVSTTTEYEKWLSVCGDGSHFVVSRLNGANGQDLYQGTLGGGAGTLIANLSSTFSETSTFVSKDCLTLYFASNRANGTQIYYSTRATINDAWGDPVPAPAPFATGMDNEDASYTPDGHLFVFASTQGNGTKDLYLSTR